VCRCGGGVEGGLERGPGRGEVGEFVVGRQRVASWAWGQTPGVVSRRDTNAER
jgi:hypothetical protein